MTEPTDQPEGQDDRDLASTIIRVAANSAGTVVGAFTSNPAVKGATIGVVALMNLIADLVQSVGRKRAEEILEQLVANPARPLTEEQLAADVEWVKAEFGI